VGHTPVPGTCRRKDGSIKAFKILLTTNEIEIPRDDKGKGCSGELLASELPTTEMRIYIFKPEPKENVRGGGGNLSFKNDHKSRHAKKETL